MAGPHQPRWQRRVKTGVQGEVGARNQRDDPGEGEVYRVEYKLRIPSPTTQAIYKTAGWGEETRKMGVPARPRSRSGRRLLLSRGRCSQERRVPGAPLALDRRWARARRPVRTGRAHRDPGLAQGG